MKLLILIIISLIIFSFLVTIIAASIETSIHEKKNVIPVFFTELKDDLLLILKTVFIHKFSIRTLKHLQQIGLYFLEIFTVCGIFLIIENLLYPIDPNHFYFELSIRFFTVFTAYQIFVYSIMSLINSASYDEWLAVVRIVKLKLLFEETGNESAKEELDLRLTESLNPYTFMTGEPKKFIEKVKDCKSISELKLLLIKAEHNTQKLNSFWRFSILLNAIK